MPNLVQQVERGLVSLLMRDAELIDDLGISSKQFGDFVAGDTYRCIESLVAAGEPVSEEIVASKLGGAIEGKRSKLYDEYVKWACGDGASSVVAGSHISSADIIHSEWIRRESVQALDRAADRLQTIGDVQETISGLVDNLELLSTGGVKERPDLITEIRSEFASISEGTGQRSGLPTGVGLETYVPGGFPRDKVTVLYGETGTFKSTLKENSIDAIASSGLGHVLNFSFEDSNQLTVQRAVSRRTGVPFARFATREFNNEDMTTLKAFDKSKLECYKNVTVIGDIPPTADEIIRIARKYKRRGLCAVVIDYLTMLDWGGGSERVMLNDAMLKFQRAAKRDGVAYIVISQLNSDKLHDRGRFDQRPKLRDLFGSSAIKNASKLCVATYKPSNYPITTKYDQELYGEIAETNPVAYSEIIELWVRKNIIGQVNVPVYIRCNVKTGLMIPIDLNELRGNASYVL